MSAEKPKKPRRARSKKLNISSKKQWEAILKSVDKNEIPLQLLEGLTVNLTDGTKVHIDITGLLNEGIDPEELQTHLDSKFEQLDDYIQDVDFFICVERVKDTVQPYTDSLLRNIK